MSSPSDAFRAYIAAVNSGDIARILAVMADNCTLAIHPRSLGMPVRSKAEFAEAFPALQKTIVDFGITISDMLESGDRAWCSAASKGKLFDGSPYNNEFVFMTRAVQVDGTWKLLEIKEFLDATAAIAVFAKAQAQAA